MNKRNKNRIKLKGFIRKIKKEINEAIETCNCKTKKKMMKRRNKMKDVE